MEKNSENQFLEDNIGGGVGDQTKESNVLTVEPETTSAIDAVEPENTAETVDNELSSPVSTNGTHDVEETPVAPLEAKEEAEALATLQAESPAVAEQEVPVLEATESVVSAPTRPISLMEQLLNEPSSNLKSLHYGEVIEGIVMYRDRDEILVDIGAKSEGIVPNKELQSLTSTDLADIKVGDGILVFVVQPENQDGHAVLSIDKAKMEKSWRKLQKQFEAGEIIEAEVTGYNKGGLLVNLEGVRGFVPASQVSGLQTGSDAAKQSEMTRLVNNKLPLKIIEINRHRNRLILSERQAAQEQRDAQKDRLMSELTAGQVREGEVTSICDFGAFVDIGGADGLVHLSELSWSRVNHPGEILKVGQRVKVFVLSIDEGEKKVALSIKRTQAEPWSQVMEKYQLGQLVEGTITQLAQFGAFARIADGIEGLIHVSELAEGRVQHPRSVVKEGDVVTLRIIRIDAKNKRMGLSLKRASPEYEGKLDDLEEGGGKDDSKKDDAAPAEVTAPVTPETETKEEE